jgi:hypothetical protein
MAPPGFVGNETRPSEEGPVIRRALCEAQYAPMPLGVPQPLGLEYCPN